MYFRRLFVVTDNEFMYDKIRRILENKEIDKLDFFCSLHSSSLFSEEISHSLISPISIRENLDFFLSNYDLGISAHSRQIFPPELVRSVLCINVHPGFNPYNRGFFPHVFSIINKLPTGATIHVMDEQIDHGDIIIQEQIKIHSFETSLDVYKRILEKEVELFEKVIDKILANDFERRKPASEGNYNSLEDFKKLAKIDLNARLSMREAIDYLRALTHPPFNNAYFFDDQGRKTYVRLRIEKVSNKKSLNGITKLEEKDLNSIITMKEAIDKLTNLAFFEDDESNTVLVAAIICR